MKTLKESLLDNIETTMKNGDKFEKQFAAAKSELKYISDCINDFNPHNAKPSKWYLWNGETNDRITIFFKTPNLTKYFNLPGKHIFIAVTFIRYFHYWDVNVIFSNANKTIIDNKHRQLERIEHIKGDVSYTFEEKNIPKNKVTKFKVDEFIKTYVSPMFNDIESFKQYVVEPYNNGIHHKEII